MEQPIIRIGNSKGLRLSKSILDRYQIKDKVEVILEEGQIILKPVSCPREGWDKAFKQMHKRGDDQLLMDDVFDDESFDQWD
jgi:antitoxin MazE